MKNLKVNEAVISKFIFPGNAIKFFPVCDEKIASSDLVCSLSGSKICKGEHYYWYHASMLNMYNNNRYKLSGFNGLAVSSSYLSYLPFDFESYERLAFNVNTCSYNDTDSFDEVSYRLNNRYGNDGLMPVLIKNRGE